MDATANMSPIMAMMDLKALLGAAIRAQRSALGISQQELAYRAGLHRTYVSDVERGAQSFARERGETVASAGTFRADAFPTTDSLQWDEAVGRDSPS
jgi:transcriptional regulator with XRE-family HTH domain